MYNERLTFRSAQRRFDNLSEEDFERIDYHPVKTCKTCESQFRQDNPKQHICEECECAGVKLEER